MADVEFKTNKLLGVEYPAVVKDVHQMVRTLGGTTRIAETFADPMYRMEIRYRPDDVFCKPAFGDRHNTTNLLLKVIRRKKTSTTPVEDPVANMQHCGEDDGYTYRCQILGIVDVTYRFQSMFDFQYLPMKKAANGSYDSIQDRLVPLKMESRDWLDKEAPLFIPPVVFSRMDASGDYQFRRESSRPDASDIPLNLITRGRDKREGFTKIVTFEDKEIPQKAHESALKQIKTKFCKKEMVDEIQKLFEERPIWSQNAIVAQVSFARNKLKFLLPIVAYYFLNGPWRTLWIRLGYDPRADPAAKKYQLLDFRVRQAGAAKKIWVGSKRSSFKYTLPNKLSQTSTRIATIQTDHLGDTSDSYAQKQVVAAERMQAAFRFQPNILPPFRQMFYQYCDIEVPAIQEILSKNDGQETSCHDRHGWLEPGKLDECRNILSTYVQELCSYLEQEERSKQREESKEESNAATDEEDEGASDLENEMEMEFLEYMREASEK